MKRLWIAAVLLVLVTGLCVGTQYYQHRQTNRLIQRLDALEATYTTDPTAAVTQAKAFTRDYQRVARLMTCYISHRDLADTDRSVTLLPAVMEEYTPSTVRVELEQIRQQLKHLRTIDDLLLENVL